MTGGRTGPWTNGVANRGLVSIGFVPPFLTSR